MTSLAQSVMSFRSVLFEQLGNELEVRKDDPESYDRICKNSLFIRIPKAMSGENRISYLWEGRKIISIKTILKNSGYSTVKAYIGDDGARYIIKSFFLNESEGEESWKRTILASEKFNASSRVLKVLASRVFKNKHQQEVGKILMPFYNRGSLFDVLNANLLPQERLHYAIEAMRAIKEIHKAGCFHGDIKCENFLIGDIDEVVCCDFEDFCELGKDSKPIPSTPNYRGPEYDSDLAEVNEKADIWAAACMLVELFIDHTDLHIDFERADKGKVLNVFFNDISEDMPCFYGIPKMQELLRAMMCRTPSSRPNASEIVDNLVSIQKGWINREIIAQNHCGSISNNYLQIIEKEIPAEGRLQRYRKADTEFDRSFYVLPNGKRIISAKVYLAPYSQSKRSSVKVYHDTMGRFYVIWSKVFSNRDGNVWRVAWKRQKRAMKMLSGKRHVVQALAHSKFIKRERYLGSKLYIGKLVMPFYTKGSLDEYLDEDYYPNYEVRCRYALQMMIGLSEIHAAGLAHGDVKPENLLIDENDNVYWSDLEHSFMPKMGEHVIGGTPSYMPPEYAMEEMLMTQKSDIWSVGCIFLGLFCKEMKHEQDRKLLIDHFLAENLRVYVERNIPEFTIPGLQELMVKIFSKEPQDRPSAREVYDSLLEMGLPACDGIS